jgi:ATP-dependent DNA ligase
MANDRERSKRINWLLIKHRDAYSVEENGAAILEEDDTSVASGRTMEAIASGKAVAVPFDFVQPVGANRNRKFEQG